jgi:hypothetical protein
LVSSQSMSAAYSSGEVGNGSAPWRHNPCDDSSHRPKIGARAHANRTKFTPAPPESAPINTCALAGAATTSTTEATKLNTSLFTSRVHVQNQKSIGEYYGDGATKRAAELRLALGLSKTAL